MMAFCGATKTVQNIAGRWAELAVLSCRKPYQAQECFITVLGKIFLDSDVILQLDRKAIIRFQLVAYLAIWPLIM